MGEAKHSQRFPRHYLQNAARVARDKVKSYLETQLKHTGFRPPVKIVADKDTLSTELDKL